MIVFLIPVRHEDSVDDYEQTWNLLNQTLTSLSNQDDTQWHAVICANKILPVLKELPHGRLTFLEHKSDFVGCSPSQLKSDVFEQHLIDKALRRRVAVAYAEQYLNPNWYFMLDADDCVSSRLVSSIHQTTKREHLITNVVNGFIVDTQRGLYCHSGDFNIICGSSVAVRPAIVHHYFNDPNIYVPLLAQHNFEKYHSSIVTLRYQRHQLSFPLVAYMQHDSNHGRGIWNHRQFEGQKISDKIREEFQIFDARH